MMSMMSLVLNVNITVNKVDIHINAKGLSKAVVQSVDNRVCIGNGFQLLSSIPLKLVEL